MVMAAQEDYFINNFGVGKAGCVKIVIKSKTMIVSFNVKMKLPFWPPLFSLFSTFYLLF